MHKPPSLLGAPARTLSDPNMAALPHDALVVVASSPLAANLASFGAVAPAIEAAVAADAALSKAAKQPVVLPTPVAPGRRLVLAPIGPLTDDIEDVCAIAEAASAAVARAVEAGTT